jgi:hypothetical protein
MQSEKNSNDRRPVRRLRVPRGPGASLPRKPAKKSNPNQNVTKEHRKTIAMNVGAFSPQQDESFRAGFLNPAAFAPSPTPKRKVHFPSDHKRHANPAITAEKTIPHVVQVNQMDYRSGIQPRYAICWILLRKKITESILLEFWSQASGRPIVYTMDV